MVRGCTHVRVFLFIRLFVSDKLLALSALALSLSSLSVFDVRAVIKLSVEQYRTQCPWDAIIRLVASAPVPCYFGIQYRYTKTIAQENLRVRGTSFRHTMPVNEIQGAEHSVPFELVL